MVGKTILHYRIQKEIGKGGMGIVYKAEDTKLHRTVAIKALAVELLGDEKARARFLREARAASAIDHPNICTVYEVNEVENVLFFVMQYVEGKTLKKVIGGRPLPLDQALELSLQITDAVAEAHRRNILHRDIKSANIMLNERSQAKILDFGLAKLLRPDSSSDDQHTAELTQAGSPFGTASYMSPEQAKGERADHRSDIFSLGVVIYEMLTGRLPFKGKTSVDVMHSVMHHEPAPMENLPPRLKAIISKAIAKEPSERYQTAHSLYADLQSFVRSRYVERGMPPADKAALLGAITRQRRPGSLLGRVASLVQRAFSMGPQKEDSSTSGSGSISPELAASIWQSSDKKAIAIMPFRNLSGLQENDFYGFSLADSVITELAQLHDLVVRPSSYVVQYQNRDVDPRVVGSQLAVDAVLIGGYIKSGDRFRLTPQLIDTGSGEIVWSEKIDVESRDIITVQDTISQHIVEGLRVQTNSREQQRLVKAPTESPEAYESYLKGRTALYKFITQTLNRSDLESAVDLFSTAVQLDPDFALAYSGLGVSYVNYVLKGMGGLEYYGKARLAFDRALEIDRKLIEPRVRMIFIDLIEGRSDEARQEIRRLLRRAPNEPSVHSTAAYVYRLSGQYELALEQWDRLLKISPTDIAYAAYNRARMFIYMRDYAKADAEIAMGMAVEPNHPMLRAYRATLNFYRGDVESATTEIREVLARHPDLHSQKITLAYCHVARGETDAALDLLDDQVIGSAQADQDTAYRLATLYAMSGKSDEAIEWLEKAIAMGNENYPWISTNPLWVPLHQDPRLQVILQKLRVKWEHRNKPN